MLDRPGFTLSLRKTARSDTSTCTPIRPLSTNHRLLHARTSSSPTITRSDPRDSPFDRHVAASGCHADAHLRPCMSVDLDGESGSRREVWNQDEENSQQPHRSASALLRRGQRSASTRAVTRIRVPTQLHRRSPRDAVCADCRAATPQTSVRTSERIPQSRFPRKPVAAVRQSRVARCSGSRCPVDDPLT
jgi:hypothetical protein